MIATTRAVSDDDLDLSHQAIQGNVRDDPPETCCWQNGESQVRSPNPRPVFAELVTVRVDRGVSFEESQVGGSGAEG